MKNIFSTQKLKINRFIEIFSKYNISQTNKALQMEYSRKDT